MKKVLATYFITAILPALTRTDCFFRFLHLLLPCSVSHSPVTLPHISDPDSPSTHKSVCMLAPGHLPKPQSCILDSILLPKSKQSPRRKNFSLKTKAFTQLPPLPYLTPVSPDLHVRNNYFQLNYICIIYTYFISVKNLYILLPFDESIFNVIY